MREVLIAEYRGMSLTTDVEFEVRGSLPSDDVVGDDWLSLWHYVAHDDSPLAKSSCALPTGDHPGMFSLVVIFVLTFP